MWPITTEEGGGCFSAGSRLVCSSFPDTGLTLRVVDIGSGDVLVEQRIGAADHLWENGVLMDWTPLSQSQG